MYQIQPEQATPFSTFIENRSVMLDASMSPTRAGEANGGPKPGVSERTPGTEPDRIIQSAERPAAAATNVRLF